MTWIRAAAPTLFVAILLSAACSSAPREARAARCDIEADDPVLQALPGVYRECDVQSPARPLQTPMHFDRSEEPRTSTCYEAEVLFVVNAQGVPEPATVQVVRSNSPALAGALTSAVRSWRYQPAEKDGQPVRQLVRARRALAVTVSRVGPGDVPTANRQAARSVIRTVCGR